jgi:hypothetical protein
LSRFTRSTRQWTWIFGSSASRVPATYGNRSSVSPSATPGGRRYACGAVDSSSGILFLYGGSDSDANVKSDIWSWNGVSWVWLAGSQSASAAPLYSAIGTPQPGSSNGMGGRESPACWHFNGTFYIGFGSQVLLGYLHSDLSDMQTRLRTQCHFALSLLTSLFGILFAADGRIGKAQISSPG